MFNKNLQSFQISVFCFFHADDNKPTRILLDEGLAVLAALVRRRCVDGAAVRYLHGSRLSETLLSVLNDVSEPWRPGDLANTGFYRSVWQFDNMLTHTCTDPS